MRLEAAAWGLVGSGTTMFARWMTRKMMHKEEGTPRLPRAVRRTNGIGTFLALAGATGVILALADVMREQRGRTADAVAQ